MVFVERLHLPGWWWLVLLLLPATIGVAVFAYVPPLTGALVTGLVAAALLLVALAYGGATVRVGEGELRVGRFRLEERWIRDAEVLTGEEAASALGAGADVRDFLQTRPYIKPLVRVTLCDPADPHPHWLISSRRPRELAAAINALAAEPS